MGSFSPIVAQNYASLYLRISPKNPFKVYSIIVHSK